MVKYILIAVVLLVGYCLIKAKSSRPRDGRTDFKAQQNVRLGMHIPPEVPVNWASHHAGLGYVGDAAIVNCEYITAIDWSRNYKWKVNLEDINRYSIEQNHENNWVHIHIFVKDGSKEVLVLHKNELDSFEKAYEEAVKSYFEMKEFIEQEEWK